MQRKNENMTDLNYQQTEVKENDEIIHSFVAKIGLVIFSAFMAVVILSAIAGEPIL